MGLRLLLALACVLHGASALRVNPTGRRSVIIGASSSLAGLALPRIAPAHADSIEDIAARSNAAAEKAAAIKAEKDKGSFVGDAAGFVGNAVLTLGIVGLLGGTAAYLFSVQKDGEQAEVSKFTKDPGGNTPTGYQSTFVGKDKDN